MSEEIVRDDIRAYTARNVFGMFTPRAAVTGLIAVAVTAGVIALTVRLELDVEASFSLIVLLCTPIGLFGLARRHDMPSEKWIPLAAEERRAPRELTLEPVSFAVERSAAEGGRGDKRPARAAKKARKKEGELDESPLAALLLAEKDSDTDGEFDE